MNNIARVFWYNRKSEQKRVKETVYGGCREEKTPLPNPWRLGFLLPTEYRGVDTEVEVEGYVTSDWKWCMG